MPYRSKVDRERPLWMTLGEALAHIQAHLCREAVNSSAQKRNCEWRAERERFLCAGRPIHRPRAFAFLNLLACTRFLLRMRCQRVPRIGGKSSSLAIAWLINPSRPSPKPILPLSARHVSENCSFYAHECSNFGRCGAMHMKEPAQKVVLYWFTETESNEFGQQRTKRLSLDSRQRI
jgi:hypothetical protein